MTIARKGAVAFLAIALTALTLYACTSKQSNEELLASGKCWTCVQASDGWQEGITGQQYASILFAKYASYKNETRGSFTFIIFYPDSKMLDTDGSTMEVGDIEPGDVFYIPEVEGVIEPYPDRKEAHEITLIAKGGTEELAKYSDELNSYIDEFIKPQEEQSQTEPKES